MKSLNLSSFNINIILRHRWRNFYLWIFGDFNFW